jgi:hypothetical protein
MARNEARRQKRLMKRRQKTKVRRKERIDPYSAEGIRKRLLTTQRLPVHECLINPQWRSSGLANILLSRWQPDGCLVAGMYLVDLLCLGLKDTFCKLDMAPLTYESKLMMPMYERTGCMECSLSLAHGIIYGGIAYAGRFNFHPHRDFRRSHHLLAGPSIVDPAEEIEFGREGKPWYVTGPHDDVTHIMNQLTAQLGLDGFHYIVGGPSRSTVEAIH